MTGASLSGAAAIALGTSACGHHGCEGDAVLRHATADTARFGDWARQHGVHGEIGETGWPAAPGWTAFARRWLSSTLEAGLPVTAFASAPRWPADAALAFYRGAGASTVVDTTGDQAVPLEEALHQGRDVGIACAEGSFGIDEADQGAYGSHAPGSFGTDYAYPSTGTLAYLAGRGHRRIRLTVGWERVQRTPFGSLDAAEVQRLHDALRAAHAAGLGVVLDLHNYGRYAGWDGSRRVVWQLGSTQLPQGSLADVWARLVGALGGEPALTGYDLMNEPHDLPGGAATWESASQQAARAIRRLDATRTLHVEGYSWSAAGSFPDQHPRPWIDDSHVVYSAHQYFDADGSGSYAASYDATRATLAARLGEGCS